VPIEYTLPAALLFAIVFLVGYKLRPNSHHRRWISIAAGVSVATIFVDLLPEISENQATFLQHKDETFALFPEQAVYLAALLGFVLFYGLEFMVAKSGSSEGEASDSFFFAQIAAFSTYCSLIAYLLVHNIWGGLAALVLYSLAMAFHLLLVDHSLARERPGLYERYGRWILALAVMGGWTAGMLVSIPDRWLARIIGFISGGVIINSLVVELPEGRGGRFWYFAASTLAYSVLLLVILH
jgi:hypothetical protein